jgi:hypothetical protein
VRRHIYSKPPTHTESAVVYAAGIGVKVDAHYPGRSVDLPCATVVVRRRDGSTGVSRLHSSPLELAEGRNMQCRMRALTFDDGGGADQDG